MSVYVDDMRAPYRNPNTGRMMIMCHMIADTSAELHEMARKIGVARRHCQYRNSWKEHYDVCLASRRKAVKEGATEITQRQLASRIWARRPRKQQEEGNERRD